MPHDHATPSPRLLDQLATLLSDQGYLYLPGLVPAHDVEELAADLAPSFAATPFCEGDFYGERTQRFGGLLTRSPKAAQFVAHAVVLGIVERVLGPFCDNLQLNLTQAIAIHPGAPAQFPHRDQDMWRGETGRIEYLVNVMWPFTNYTPQNGGTLIWPGSHAPDGLHVGSEREPLGGIMEPGSALLFLGSTLHGAGANRSKTVRRGMIVSYCLGWLKPYENQWLVYPPDVARTFSPELAALVGYRQHRPNLGNVEGRCPSLLLGEVPSSPLGAADALRPEQIEAVAAYAAGQQ
ncbi:phytanoyl-CoA dioxygenase family protein [Telmatospirillum sp.]|uniref:phytanoyl-CoA dioxygenase family protein n=1 Tax=Telmatospirillum sp. TaxID=2079197 RepID=UPI00283BC632|nr:phytanoyl-CoA dioxygenase family protein [Telmatospirillum sp.]MDR3438111.1 phytanoyl-CoA dioxygenase family protein [Telmatospirillum sp.]